MRVLLTTLNAKFIHSCLAIRYLARYCQSPDWEIMLAEYTINDPILTILGDLYRYQADVIGFSCYIWNISQTLELTRLLKKIVPATCVILGGPEVSYEPAEILIANPDVDIIVRGEGEETLRELLETIHRGGSLKEVKGLAYRDEEGPKLTPERPLIKDLDQIPFPYTGELLDLKNRVVYYESTRGCPFSCQYCLSSTIAGVRFFSLPRVLRDLAYLIERGVKQVNFVDRTFNCRKEHYWPILKFLAEYGGSTEFHFEIAADLFDSEVLDWLARVPTGRFRFEIGVQSTHPPTLKAIQRKMDFSRLARAVQQIRCQGRIYQHLDLIVGLPEENWEALKRSFNDVYALRPDMLQIGFLKLLKGSGLRRTAKQYGYVFMDQPPYEVLANRWLSYTEIRQLKILEDVFERYYNSHRFIYSLEFALARYPAGPFDWYARLAEFWEAHGWHLQAHNPTSLGEKLDGFYRALGLPDYQVFCEVLKLDYLCQVGIGSVPEFLNRENGAGFREKRARFFGEYEMKEKYFPEFAALTARELSKVLHLEIFNCDVVTLASAPARQVAYPEPTVVLFKKTSAGVKFVQVEHEDFFTVD
ncbi:MAG: B12-binding domain-containing radical SAM protein [Firmicutes bacterium]|nr:B12-binding domain-containing radical SAM protein [Bacillota bacterium]